MTIEQAIDTALRADTTLIAMIGGTSPRLYWIQALQTATLPYVVYQNIADTDEQLYFDSKDTGVARIQFSIVGDKRADKSILYRIRTILRGMNGTIGGASVELVEPSGIRETFNAESGRYVFFIDFDIHYSYA